jgi:thiol peroxidase
MKMNTLNITMGGNPISLPFAPLSVGVRLPDFVLTANDLSPVASEDLTGLRVFLTVPSLDTPVCDLEVRTFNTKAAELPGVAIYAISMDLPFAQARWCGTAGVEAVKALSDYRNRSFGKATGTLIDGLMLLTRAVFIVDATGTVVYAQYVPEVTDAPDYEAAYQKLATLV